MSHEGRMEIAAGLRDRILEVYGDTVLAVFVTSSTAKDLDQPHSDLELTAVMRDGVAIDDKSYVYKGILVEISYSQESAILKDARRVTPRWPIEADVHRSRVVLFERDEWTRRLSEAVAAQEESGFSRALHLATTMVVEARDKLRNAFLAEDHLNIRVNAFWLAHDAANLTLLLNRRYMVTSRRFFEQAFECPETPANFRGLMELLIGISPAVAGETITAGERLAAALLEMAASRGVSVESKDLLV